MRDINFFSEYIKIRNSLRNKIIIAAAIFAGFSLIIAGAFIFIELTANALKADIASMETYLRSEEVLTKQQEMKEKRQRLDMMNKYMSIVDAVSHDIENSFSISSDLIESINKNVPQEVVFKNLSLTAGVFSTQGSAGSRIAIAELYYNMTSSGIFDDVYIGNISMEGEDSQSYTFDIRCTFKDVIGK